MSESRIVQTRIELPADHQLDNEDSLGGVGNPVVNGLTNERIGVITGLDSVEGGRAILVTISVDEGAAWLGDE